MRMRLRYWSPCFEIGPSFCLPPVESCRGTIPIQAAKSRPERKTLGSGTTAAIVVAPITPNAGDGLEPLTCFVRAMLRNDPLLERSDHRLHSLKLRREYGQAGVGIGRQARTSSCATIANNSLIPSRRCAAVMPNSAHDQKIACCAVIGFSAGAAVRPWHRAYACLAPSCRRRSSSWPRALQPSRVGQDRSLLRRDPEEP